jgi:hypothetical protein
VKAPTSKGGTPLPPGARMVPGSVAYEKAKGAPLNKPAVIDRKFVASPKGGPELVARHGVAVKGNRSKTTR